MRRWTSRPSPALPLTVITLGLFGFVITAHGYGHASREMEVLRVLLSRRPTARAVVLTRVPEEVFADYFGGDPRIGSRIDIVPYGALHSSLSHQVEAAAGYMGLGIGPDAPLDGHFVTEPRDPLDFEVWPD